MQNDRRFSISDQKSIHNSPSGWIPRKGMLTLFGVFLLVFTLTYGFMSALFHLSDLQAGTGVIISAPLDNGPSETSVRIREFPNTLDGIYVFNDQLATWEMSEEQYKFAGTHYAGTQKVFPSDARRFRAYNPAFLVLNYRLGPGLGYQIVGDNCTPDGTWIELIEGEKWVREYPDDPKDEWFFKYNDQKVFSCEWGWYLMDSDNPSWREYWSTEVLRQLGTNQADGVFVDSLFPPNYVGGNNFKPNIRDVDPSFEKDWSRRIEDFISHMQTGELKDYTFIVNVGEWITSRDKTDYSNADGIMVEGFARWADGQYFDASEQDWQLQMDRILSQILLDKIVILQQYVEPENIDDRLFILSSYLLLKGNHTFINMEYASPPEWFPEYEVQIGSPSGDMPESISALWRSDWNVYARYYNNGLIIVNPSNENRSIELFQDYLQVLPYGGGIVPENGDITDWTIDYKQTSYLELQPNQGIILLNNITNQ